MMSEKFSKGFLVYQVSQIQQVAETFLDKSAWANGFYAFSHKEVAMREVDVSQLTGTDLYHSRVDIDNESTYLNEINLWRHQDGCFEEIVLEREDRYFILQQWRLYTQGIEKTDDLKKKLPPSYPCYFKKTDTIPDKTALFGPNELVSLEIIVPEKRLHFFLTTGEV